MACCDLFIIQNTGVTENIVNYYNCNNELITFTAETGVDFYINGCFEAGITGSTINVRNTGPTSDYFLVSGCCTEDTFVLNQTEDIPSYIRTFNHIIGLASFLDKNDIPYYFFNTFYDYKFPLEPETLIDTYGKPTHQLDLKSLWKQLPPEFKNETMYSYIKDNGGELLKRNHPSAISHEIWANHLI